MVALLRGVNVGGRHRVAMGKLRELLTEDGFTGVATHLQSGNVVLTTSLGEAELADRLGALLARRLGFAVPVAVRDAAALATVLARDPLPGAAADPRRYVVTFLAAEPTAAALARLRGLVAGDERLHAVGRELYSHHPAGQARSRLAAGLTAPDLGTAATARNWSTVTALSELSA